MRAQRPETTAVLLLVGIAALQALLDAAAGWPQDVLRAAPAPPALPAAGSRERKAMEWCLQNVAMIHDVYWASACSVEAEMQQARRVACQPHCAAGLEPLDDSPDCTLPEHRARELNTARAKAEQQCMDEATKR
ncbi:MAG TPA: hypothetical protein VFM98_23700 [Ramlibacter sp.]|uniref:hypothetical protein n=1 Tax=Ramlibacter sp. TaxID=1917967 RepID=UPI002D7F612C|nr:hypothetical protein [Ramlibacter sp.]HET8748619.1 hypothetical protein [Ramlibacter sp.]